MPLYRVEEQQSGLETIKPSTFAEVGMQERKDLQTLLLRNSAAIDPEIWIFAEEFSNWQESSRRIDLLAIDRDANLVVIELKSVQEGGHMELQAIRYAAMVSAMDFEAVVEAYEKLRAKRGLDPVGARQKLLDFLKAANENDVTVSSTPRIILMAPSFSKEITTAVLWLNKQKLNIKCLQIKPYKIHNELYLDVEQVIPLPSAEDYIVGINEKVTKAEDQAKAKRRERSIKALVDQGILQKGIRLHLIKTPRPGMTITDEKAKQATFLEGQSVRWDYDNGTYSLSALCRKLCEEFKGEVGSGAFAGPDYWAIEGEEMSLSERARTSGDDGNVNPSEA